MKVKKIIKIKINKNEINTKKINLLTIHLHMKIINNTVCNRPVETGRFLEFCVVYHGY